MRLSIKWQLALVSVAMPIKPTTAAGPEHADSAQTMASSVMRLIGCGAMCMASAAGRVGCWLCGEAA